MINTKHYKRHLLAAIFIFVSIVGLTVLIPQTSLDQKGYSLPFGWKDDDPNYLRATNGEFMRFGFPLTFNEAGGFKVSGTATSDPWNIGALVLDFTVYGLLGWLGYKYYGALQRHE